MKRRSLVVLSVLLVLVLALVALRERGSSPLPGAPDVDAQRSASGRALDAARAEASEHKPVEAQVDANAALAGTLVNHSHEAVPLGRVLLVKLSPGAGSEPAFAAGASSETVADARGRFSFAALASGPYRLTASADGYASAIQIVSLPHAPGLFVVLEQAGFLQGRVEDEAGRAVSDVEVFATSAVAGVRETTGSEGTYSFQLAASSYLLTAVARDGRTAQLAVPVPVVLGQTITAPTLRLAKGARLSGRITMRGDRAVLAASITATLPGGSSPIQLARSDDHGRYAMSGLPSGALQLRISASGFKPLEKHLSLLRAQQAEMNFQLTADGAVGGFVRDTRGAPIPGASVRGSSRLGGAQGDAIEAETLTEADGHYLLDGLSPGKTRLVASRAGTIAGPVQTVDIPEDGLAQADFVIPDLGTFAGHISLKDRKPTPRPAVVTVSLKSLANDFRATAQIPSDPNGDFSAQLPEGDYAAGAKLLDANYGGNGSTANATITAGQTTRMDFVVDDDQGDSIIQVTIIDIGGAPAAGAGGFFQAMMGRQQLRARAPAADAQGVMRLTRWEGMTGIDAFDVVAVLNGRTGRATLQRPDTEATIALGPAAALRGTILGMGEGPATVTISSADGSGLPFGVPSQLISGGSFQFDDISPSVALVHVATEDGRTGEKTVTLIAGQVADVQIDLLAPASASGRILDESGKPLAGFVMVDGGSRDNGDLVGADGVFRIPNLSPGEHKIEIMLTTAYELVTRTFTVQAGDNLDLGDFVLAKSHEKVKTEKLSASR